MWLNGKVRASLDTSAPLVGAPAAGQAGHTGKGVTVAVLDTGIDGERPALHGKVANAKDFTGGGSPADKAGHGTHVASTIAGSGSKYRGIAPDARLAVGKMPGGNGEGQFDDLIAGMQWAAAEVKAKVVNMSVGGFPSDGTDPLSMTLNTLSRKHNTLFVVAAGEFGKHTVRTPASADAALAVGNITRAGQVNERSSTGPRLDDGAVKPEISAPGTGIVAARAAGTGAGEEVEQHYVRKSGTSMAAPHVAGGAAILAGLHPGWSAERLKSALVGSATPLPEANVYYAVGSGKLDVHRAVTTAVRASTASVHTFLPWGGKPVQEQEVTYENTGSAAVTLALDLKLASAKLSATTVTVPANGNAKVRIAFGRGTPGEHGGVLSASTVDGKVVVRTPVSVAIEAEMYDLTPTMLDRGGKPGARGSVDVINLETGARHRTGAGAKLRLPAGKYMISAMITTGETSITTVAFPEFTLTKTSTVTRDARKANRVVVGTDRPSVRGGGVVTQVGARRPGYNTRPQMQLLFADPRLTALRRHRLGRQHRGADDHPGLPDQWVR
ncbi:S8 family serine peptidase [Allokutzneria albata]|uniref:S8 family serine peptidase n=1 Tax=Allokutzneria albata TaxID=211114 RepID=UPI0006939234|nr:S8 family serine peptidase [Allokutzneria albata]